MRRRTICSLTLTAILCASASPSLADALDGQWCNNEDGRLAIDGNIITTPAGDRVEGDYGRHRFVYIAPPGSWNAGKRIVIQQLSDQEMELSVGDGMPHKWGPCQVVS